MSDSETPEEAVLRRMIRDADKEYAKLDKPTFNRISTGNDPKQAGLDCTEFQPTERTALGNFCFQKYLINMTEKANAEFGKNSPHCFHANNLDK